MRPQDLMTLVSKALVRLSNSRNLRKSCQSSSSSSRTSSSSVPSLQELNPPNTIRSFLFTFSYPAPNPETNACLIQTLSDAVASWNIPDAELPQRARVKLTHLSASFAEMCYPQHSLELQVQIALYTYLIIYIDDQAERIQVALESFQKRMVLGLPQLGPFLAQFPAVLADMYQFYDPLSANSIIASSLEFISGCVLEVHQEILSMQCHRLAQNWPNFLRRKTGVSAAYAYLIFPKDGHRDMGKYIQAIPDIMNFIDLTNDVLSFYKEELAGETSNFIHNRARAANKSPASVHAEVGEEAETACFAVCGILDNSSQARSDWRAFYKGYIAWHVGQDRYKLSQIGM